GRGRGRSAAGRAARSSGGPARLRSPPRSPEGAGPASRGGPGRPPAPRLPTAHPPARAARHAAAAPAPPSRPVARRPAPHPRPPTAPPSGRMGGPFGTRSCGKRGPGTGGRAAHRRARPRPDYSLPLPLGTPDMPNKLAPPLLAQLLVGHAANNWGSEGGRAI